jgi:cytochrome c5
LALPGVRHIIRGSPASGSSRLRQPPEEPALSEKNDNNVFVYIVPLLCFLAISGLLMFIIYDRMSELGWALHTGTGPTYDRMVEARIRPVGQVAIAGEAIAPPPDVAEPPVAELLVELDGEAVYNRACTTCHGPAIAGAPRTGDPEHWHDRLEQGMDTLVEHAILGFQGATGFMPPRGGHPDLTDEQVRDAVQFMVDQLP